MRAAALSTATNLPASGFEPKSAGSPCVPAELRGGAGVRREKRAGGARSRGDMVKGRRKLAQVRVAMNKSFLPPLGRRLSVKDADAGLASEILQLSRASVDAVWSVLRASPDGLEAAEAKARLASSGPNLIAKEGRPSVVKELWGRARNPLNALLLSLAATSYFLGDFRAAVVILIMVVLAITTAFVQEHRSNDAAAKLRAMVKTTASVKRRDAAVTTTEDQSQGFVEIAIDQLVPGDIVRLSAGDMIPADLRLLSAKDLFVNQAALTGEAMPSEKSALPAESARSPIPSSSRTSASWAPAWSADLAPA